MKKNSLLQRLLKKDGGRQKSPYQGSSFRSAAFTGQQRQTGQKTSRVARIRQWLATRDSRGQQSYNTSKKKSVLRKRLAGITIVVIITVLFLTLDGTNRLRDELLSVDFFQISSFEIIGNSIVSTETIRDASAIIVHQSSMFGISAEELERKIAAVPWIASVEVKKNWPSSLTISVKENVPLALMLRGGAVDSQLYYMDKKGVSFLPVKSGGDLDFPVITGLAEISNEQIKTAALTEVLVFLSKVRRNDPHLPAQSLSEIHVNKTGELVVYLVEYPFPIFFGNGNTKQKYNRLVQVLKALYKKEKGKMLISEIEYIKMDYQKDKVLVAQAGGAD